MLFFRGPKVWVVAATLLTLLIITPIALVVVNVIGADSQTLMHLKQTVLSRYINNTLLLLAGVGVLTLIFGILSAYFLVFYEFRFAKFFSIALILPFLIPSYILGFIYSDILGFFGPFHLFLIDLGIKNYFDVLDFNSVVILLSLALYPYIFLIVKASFSKHSGYLLNPALSLKAGRFKIFYKLILPLSRPAVIAGLSLVMMETISEYGLVKYYGVDTLSTAVFTAWFGLNDLESAAYISSIAMMIVFAILIIERLNRGNAKYKVEATPTPITKVKPSLSMQAGIIIFLSIPFIFGFFIPALWIGYYSIEHIEKLFEAQFFSVLFNSFSVAFITAAAIMVIAVILAYSARIYDNRYMHYLLKAAVLGYSIPGAVIAVGVIIVAAAIDNYLIQEFALSQMVLSGSLFILCFGYSVRFLAVGLNSVESSFEKVGSNLNKASQSLNKSLFTTLLKVDLPLIKGGLFAGFILVFIDIIKELPATLILRPFNYETLATKTYELASIELVQESSVYALAIIIVSLIPVLLILRNYR